jgi:hypothetical protein
MENMFLIDYIGEANLYLRVYGEIAFLYLTLALLVSPIVSLIKSKKYIINIIFSRKIL